MQEAAVWITQPFFQSVPSEDGQSSLIDAQAFDFILIQSTQMLKYTCFA